MEGWKVGRWRQSKCRSQGQQGEWCGDWPASALGEFGGSRDPFKPILLLSKPKTAPGARQAKVKHEAGWTKVKEEVGRVDHHPHVDDAVRSIVLGRGKKASMLCTA